MWKAAVSFSPVLAWEERGMDEVSVWSTFEARPGKEAEVEEFLRQCAEGIRRDEPGTSVFYALKIGPGRYATFNTMRDEAAFQAHLHRKVARTVQARADELFAAPMQIVQTSILAASTQADK